MIKYKLTEETRECNGRTLYRIQSLRDFGNIKSGQLGGWIESESNLSQEGDCWVANNASVSGKAEVCDDAQVSGNAQVYGEARVFGKAWVYGAARVSGNAQVFGKAWVYGNALVYDDAEVSDDAEVHDDASIIVNRCTPKKSSVPEFNFSTLPNEVEEVVIAGVRYKKETTWKKI